MIDQVAAAKRVLDEWTKTKQPLKERATILPFGQYEDGSVGMAWPGLLAAPVEGMQNFGRYGYDSPEAIADNARSAFDVAGGAVTGGLGVGLAGGLADDAVRAAPKTAQAIDDGFLLPERYQIAKALGDAAKASPETGKDGIFYRGVNIADQPTSPHRQEWWASDSPRVAATYATLGADGAAPAVYPSRMQFKNPLEVDAMQYDFTSVPFERQMLSTDSVARIAKERGHDGVVFRNVLDEADLGMGDGATTSTVAAALRPGTVYSATTGDLLYSNAPTGSSVPLAVNALERAQPQVGPRLVKTDAQRNPRGQATPFSYDIVADDGRKLGVANGDVVGDTMHFDFLGDIDFQSQNQLGIGALRALREQLRADFPDVKRFEGLRMSGPRAELDDDRAFQSVYIPANAPTGAAVPLAQETQDTDPALLEYLRMIGL